MPRPHLAAPRTPPPPFECTPRCEERKAQLVAIWRALCEDERDSVIAATLVAGDLARLGAPPAILVSAARVVEDEIRHVQVCVTVLEALGAAPAEIDPEARRASLGDAPSIEDRTALTLVAGFGVGESMSAGWFASARRTCREPLIRWAFTEILRDEARHGSFGIDVGRWLMRDWSVLRRRALWPECVSEMEQFERRLGGPIAAGEVVAADLDDMAVGILTPRQSCAAAVGAVERWVIPALSRLGVLPLPS